VWVAGGAGVTAAGNRDHGRGDCPASVKEPVRVGPGDPGIGSDVKQCAGEGGFARGFRDVCECRLACDQRRKRKPGDGAGPASRLVLRVYRDSLTQRQSKQIRIIQRTNRLGSRPLAGM
jgi:hypothetical protein